MFSHSKRSKSLVASETFLLNKNSIQSRNGSRSTRLERGNGLEEKRPVYTHHYVVDEGLCGQIIGAGGQSIKEIKAKSGGIIYLDKNQLPLEGLRTFVIRGTLPQVGQAVRLISQKIGSQGSVSEQAQKFWLQWVQHVFPNMESQAYFLPPVSLKRVPMTREMVAGQQVLVKSSQFARDVTASDSDPCSSVDSFGSVEDIVGAQHVGQSVAVHIGTTEHLLGQNCSARFHSPDENIRHFARVPICQSLPLKRVDLPTLHDADTGVLKDFPVQHHTVPNVSVCHPVSNDTDADVIQPLPVQDTDVKADADLDRVLLAFKRLARKNGEVFFCLSQLKFGMYLGMPCYSAAAAQLPSPGNLPEHLPPSWRQGDFDVLIIHRLYGLITCEIKTCGYNFQDLQMSQQDIDNQVRKKVSHAAAQVDKAKAVLSHLVSDIAPGLRITKVIVLPNLTSGTVERAVGSDPHLTQDSGRCMAANPDITHILCSDQMGASEEIHTWWQRNVTARGPDLVISSNITLYKILVARFCGPATAVTIPCLSHPRLSVKTLAPVVSATGVYYTQITLFPEQVELLHRPLPRVFLAGPPGTGKSVMLQLKATEWIRDGNDVVVLSTWENSRLASSMLYNLLWNQTNDRLAVKADVITGQVQLVQFDFWRGKDQEKALEYFRQAAKDGCLHVVVDEAGPDYSWPEAYFQIFCMKLLEIVPCLHLWAASCTHEVAPASDWRLELLTKPLRCPPVVVREVEKEQIFREGRIKLYDQKWEATLTDGPRVKSMYHVGVGHSEGPPLECFRCGENLATFLKTLSVEKQASPKLHSNSAPFVVNPPALLYKDVIILCVEAARDNCGLIEGLSANHIPVKVMKDSDVADVASAHSDVTWVAGIDRVRGLEKKVVVCVGLDYVGLANQVRLYGPSRCSSQLVWLVSSHDKP